MSVIIPLILIGVSLLAIFVMIIRKFSVLASLDIQTIPAEKEAKFKEQLVESRLNRSMVKISSRLTWIFRLIQEKIAGFFKRIDSNLHEMKKDYSSQADQDLTRDEKEGKIEKLFVSIDEEDEEDDFAEIEKRLIDIIGLDSKNVQAFEKLGEIYYKNKKYEEAKQAFEHSLKLLKDTETDKQAEIYFDLSLVQRDIENNEEALNMIKKAIKLSPNNPRFLDAMLEISIMNNDKTIAEDAYEKLLEVNPDNQKLSEFKDRIKDLN